ncbi:family 16 glycosylhydrolase [Sphingobacterium corticibacterium]|uniref:Glycosyl hydrolase family protein n=1 Tax=Sphingobacterium corticibacterium TaxID=2484746 RepID=A0A4Q6XK47_9SPHI|nr:family 16 glycosylhydrolase [Sphingobacterium corticibacterium]RZF59755.1 glycosyl hydrolase family protein [Sphingobacterium corticibacterium]
MMLFRMLLYVALPFFLGIPLVSAKKNKPIKTTIVQQKGDYTLMRGGKPYFIKGAGGSQYLKRLKAYGGNSIRTWSPHDAGRILDEAYDLGLTVTLGLSIQTERHGFDYNNGEAVAKQLEATREVILKYKDHPALLAWGIGNELNLHYTNPKVWDAVNDIANMIHQVDGNHLVTTMLAGVNKKEIDYIKERCPALDLIAVQVYGGLASVPQQIKDAGWNKAYIVTEWGPTGHWEVVSTPWGAPIEETSREKAMVYKQRYQASIANDKSCLGSYVFLWGQKQERTPTWYGLFTEDGEENEVVDVMQYLWSGGWPANRAPHLEALTLDGKRASDFPVVEPGKSYAISASVSDPDDDKLAVRWELLEESTDLKEGGDREERPAALSGLVTAEDGMRARLTAPDQVGAYRLFVYVTDGHNNVATANIPFYVTSAVDTFASQAYRFTEHPVWADEFDYEGLPNTEKWSYDIGGSGWGNNELQYYTEARSENVKVADGLLTITARKEAYEGSEYTSTRLISKGKGDFLYGRFEVKAKVPQGRGTWPAAWMLPTDWTYGDWPASGEIDILEHVGYDQDVVHISVHTEDYNHVIGTQKTAFKKIENATTEFHTFRVDWTPAYIRGFVDDVQLFNFPNEGTGYKVWPFDQKFHWLLNLAVGGNWGGQQGIDDEAFPAQLQIDYVRVYDLLNP